LLDLQEGPVRERISGRSRAPARCPNLPLFHATKRIDRASPVGNSIDLIDYTVPRHAYAAGLPYAGLEVRQDLIAGTAGQAA
jgi:hypothetical protein